MNPNLISLIISLFTLAFHIALFVILVNSQYKRKRTIIWELILISILYLFLVKNKIFFHGDEVNLHYLIDMRKDLDNKRIIDYGNFNVMYLFLSIFNLNNVFEYFPLLKYLFIFYILIFYLLLLEILQPISNIKLIRLFLLLFSTFSSSILFYVYNLKLVYFFTPLTILISFWIYEKLEEYFKLKNTNVKKVIFWMSLSLVNLIVSFNLNARMETYFFNALLFSKFLIEVILNGFKIYSKKNIKKCSYFQLALYITFIIFSILIFLVRIEIFYRLLKLPARPWYINGFDIFLNHLTNVTHDFVSNIFGMTYVSENSFYYIFMFTMFSTYLILIGLALLKLSYLPLVIILFYYFSKILSAKADPLDPFMIHFQSIALFIIFIKEYLNKYFKKIDHRKFRETKRKTKSKKQKVNALFIILTIILIINVYISIINLKTGMIISISQTEKYNTGKFILKFYQLLINKNDTKFIIVHEWPKIFFAELFKNVTNVKVVGIPDFNISLLKELNNRKILLFIENGECVRFSQKIIQEKIKNKERYENFLNKYNIDQLICPDIIQICVVYPKNSSKQYKEELINFESKIEQYSREVFSK